MSNSLPTLSSLPGAEQVPLPTSTAVERIFAAYQDENGPGLDGLSRKDKLVHSQLEAAYALILNYHSFEQAWPLLAKQFAISRPTCYRRLRDAQNLFGDFKKVKKEGRRTVLLEFAQKLLQLSLTMRPPDVKSALAAMKFIADITGLRRADAHGEDEGTGTGNTSYVLNLTVEGRKSRQFDLTRPEEISDADYELIEEAVSENVVNADQMQLLISQAKEGGGKL
ncbi:hypothetical protein QMK33_19260 [Hymenobacter sp. H14-R3]|uniref:hypothetical protein n=1 Tax=Hymenobacter sp. H14-R3 TaxID=3046308 RepID=UPI0024BB63DC|nr:hypothetical protein [Hymenobacter sp. H14-R3]MDJ0367292.1 hypothetical protein [Hymenobacter sp. H14-R3]